METKDDHGCHRCGRSISDCRCQQDDAHGMAADSAATADVTYGWTCRACGASASGLSLIVHGSGCAQGPGGSPPEDLVTCPFCGAINEPCEHGDPTWITSQRTAEAPLNITRLRQEAWEQGREFERRVREGADARRSRSEARPEDETGGVVCLACGCSQAPCICTGQIGELNAMGSVGDFASGLAAAADEVEEDFRQLVERIRGLSIASTQRRNEARPISPTKTSAATRRLVREELHGAAFGFLNDEDRQFESGHDRFMSLMRLLEDAWDGGWESQRGRPEAQMPPDYLAALCPKCVQRMADHLIGEPGTPLVCPETDEDFLMRTGQRRERAQPTKDSELSEGQKAASPARTADGSALPSGTATSSRAEALESPGASSCPNASRDTEIGRLKTALGEIAALGERCEDCDPSEAPMATHTTSHVLTGMPIMLCADCAKNAREAHRKAESKGCGPQPEVEEYEQETAVTIALAALGGGA